jgi:hypothetical protein
MSSGGRGYFSDSDIEELRQTAVERLKRTRLDAEANSVLREELATINDRDVDKVNDRLDDIRDALADQIEDFDRLRFGGSVAKHTAVDGLSDVDSIVLLKDDATERSPEEVQAEITRTLRGRLPQGDIDAIEVGRLAVTVRYRDGEEIQLLPAVPRGREFAISSADGRSWSGDIDAQAFARTLTQVNQRQGNMVIPTIKLAKAMFENKLGDAAPTGYHVEALAVAAFEGYTGPRNHRAMLTHFVASASENARRPIQDVTGQSPHVDADLGGVDSAARQALARRLNGLRKTLESSQSARDWQALFE